MTETTPKRGSRRRAQAQGSARFGAFLAVVGAAIFMLGAWGVAQGARTWSWPRADATIVTSDLRVFDAGERRLANGDSYRDQWYSFAVHYVYEVNGIEYVGGGVEPYDFGMQNSAGAQKMKDRHPVGSTAKVAYSPDDPKIAYIEPGPSSFAMILTAIGAIIGLVGLWVNGLVLRGRGRMHGGKPAP